MAGAWAAWALGCDPRAKGQNAGWVLSTRASVAGGRGHWVNQILSRAARLLFVSHLFLEIEQGIQTEGLSPKARANSSLNWFYFIYDAIFIFVWTWTFESVEENFKYEME